MAFVNFRKQLEDKVLQLVKTAVSSTATPIGYVKTFDRYLHDIALEDYPYIVVTVRQVEQMPGEMGTLREINEWDVIIYYLDISKNFEEGELRRDNICNTIQYTLELDPRLGDLRVPLGVNTLSQYVYDSNFSSMLFDVTGQQDFYTFVTEMNLSVNTAKN